MIKSHRRHLAALVLAVAVLALSLAVVTSPVYANPGLSVGGALLVRDVAPGQTLTHNMKVSIGENDTATDIAVQVTGMTQSLDGVNDALAASEDTSPYSARSFITVDKSSFHLEPGASQDVIATIQIPPDVGAGGRYALINIKAGPTGEGQVATVAAVNVPIALTIKGSQLLHEGEITKVSLSEATSGQPVNIVITFENTGNHHFKVKGEVTVKNAQGQSLDTISIPVTASSVLPGAVRQMKAAFIPKGELAPGTYTISSKVMLEDDSLLDEASSTLEVETPYAPPPAVGSTKLTLSSASTLKTEDGRISVSFPKGAVISQVEVSLSSYPLEQLPSPPANFELATTGFRIDGLTGLLAKEATITVKYSQADLEKAEGDASRLKLARWDEGNNQWSVLKTRVDKGATTLTTTTNQLSIWAVMVAPPTELNWVVIGGIVGGVIIIALLVFFLAVRRRGY